MTDSPAPKHRKSRLGRRRFAPIAVIAGVAASAAIAASMTGTLGAFTASITNDNNTTATGNLTMQEIGASATCNSTDSTGGAAGADAMSNGTNNINTNAYFCSTINKYGGSTVFVPGSSSTQTVTLKNTGSVAASTFSLTPGACMNGTNGSVNGSSTDLCSKLTISVYAGTSATAPQVGTTKTLTAFGTGGAQTLATLAAGASAPYTFVVSFPTGGANDNTFQGRSVSQNLVWAFTAGS